MGIQFQKQKVLERRKKDDVIVMYSYVTVWAKMTSDYITHKKPVKNFRIASSDGNTSSQLDLLTRAPGSRGNYVCDKGMIK